MPIKKLTPNNSVRVGKAPVGSTGEMALAGEVDEGRPGTAAPPRRSYLHTVFAIEPWRRALAQLLLDPDLPAGLFSNGRDSLPVHRDPAVPPAPIPEFTAA